MQIELDAATVARLKKQAEAQALKLMVDQIMAQFDAKQIAGEVKNAAIRVASQRIATEIKTTHQTSEIVNRALQSAEETVRRVPKPELTPHEEYTVAQVKALLKQWPKTLVLELDEHSGTVNVSKRDKPSEAFVSATEVASFRKPSLFLRPLMSSRARLEKGTPVAELKAEIKVMDLPEAKVVIAERDRYRAALDTLRSNFCAMTQTPIIESWIGIIDAATKR